VAILKTCRFQQTGGFGILEKKSSAFENLSISGKKGVKGLKERER
jgi:hypothetical protein